MRIMQTINIGRAKTHLSRLVEEAAKGQAFVIAKGGRPMVKVVPLDDRVQAGTQRLGFMQGEFTVPDDFDRLGSAEIEALFGDE